MLCKVHLAYIIKDSKTVRLSFFCLVIRLKSGLAGTENGTGL